MVQVIILAQQYEKKGRYQDVMKYYSVAAMAGNINAMVLLIDQYK